MAQDTRSEGFPSYRLAGLLGGRYQITGLIAAGGMAEVYEAHDTVLDRRVAVKILHATYGADSEFVERFRREAMSAGRLNHPNIVQVYDWGRSDDGAAYMVMELVRGKTLRQILTDRGALPLPAAAAIAEQIGRALEVARRAGIVHRDIKPENILMSPDGHAKVADFGVARALAESRATQAGMVLGTASYLAPEQVEGHPGDHRSDLYALGTMLFEMCTGTTPFRGDNPVVVAYRRVAEDVPALRSVRIDAPQELENVVSRATARNPSERYQTAADMAAALAPLAGDVDWGDTIDLTGDPAARTQAIPVATAETTVIRRRVKPKRGRRGLITVLAALLLLGLIPLGIRTFGKVQVPVAAGMTQEQATAAIEEAGLTPVVVLKNHPTVPPGSVIATSPVAGAQLRRGTKVTMTVSLGPAIVVLPSVVGKPEREAIDLLVKKKLRVIKQTAFHSTVPLGKVISQKPDPGSSVNEGTQITIVVSKGAEQIVVPKVAGLTISEATDALKGASFGVTVTRVASESVPRDRVVGSNPAGGAKAAKGSTVTISVSEGPSEFPAPDVRGEKYDDAVKILAGYGLRAKRKQVPDSFGDVVISQTPRPGKMVKRGDEVILYTA